MINEKDVLDQLTKETVDKILSCKNGRGDIHYSVVLKIMAHLIGDLERFIDSDRVEITIKEPKL